MEEKYYLANLNFNWADEIDFHETKVINQETYDEIQRIIGEKIEPVPVRISNNEEALVSVMDIDIKEISKEEAQVFKKYDDLLRISGYIEEFIYESLYNDEDEDYYI